MTGQADWRDQASCREGDAGHLVVPATFERKPEKDCREGAARTICRACPVRVSGSRTRIVQTASA